MRGNLVFNDVSFSYPSRPERKVRAWGISVNFP